MNSISARSILRGPIDAFYSISFYQKVAREWEGEPFLYLLWLLTVTGLALSIVFGIQFMKIARPMYYEVIQQVPKIHIAQGRASAEGPLPLTLRAHVSGKEIPIAMIDTQDHFKSIEETGTSIWLNSHELVVLNKGEKRIRSLASIKEATIDQIWLREKMRLVMKLAFAFSIPFLLLVMYVYRLLQALLYAVVGLVCNAFFGSRLSFPALWRLSLVAMTPSIVISTLQTMLLQKMHLPRFTLALLTLIYLGFAVWANIPNEDQA